MPSTKSKTKLKFEAIGTTWEIEVFSSPITNALSKAISDRIALFDNTYSRFRSDSWIWQLNSHPGKFELPPDARPLLEFYKQLYVLTNGKITPLIGQNLIEAGYDSSYSLKARPLTDLPTWEEAIELGADYITIKIPVMLDVGAAGKGYLIDIIGGLLDDYGQSSFVIDAGGDMLIRNVEPAQRVGLENPLNFQEVIGYVDIGNSALCASAGNRRRWADFHHIIDPATKKSPNRLSASWVMADNAMLADGLATALMLGTAEKFQKQYTFEYATVDQNGHLRASSGFQAKFF